MLSGAVKTQLHAAFPDALINDSYGASETGASGSEIGASTTSDRPAFATDGRTWVLDPDTLAPLEPGSGRKACSRAGATSRSATGRTTRRPRRRSAPTPTACGGSSPAIRHDRRAGSGRAVRAGIRLHQHRRREGLPGRGRGRDPRPCRRVRRGRRRPARRALRPESGRAGAAARWRAGARTRAVCRRTAARCSRATRCRAQLLLGDAPRTNVGKPDYATATQLAREQLGVA